MSSLPFKITNLNLFTQQARLGYPTPKTQANIMATDWVDCAGFVNLYTRDRRLAIIARIQSLHN